MAQRPVKADRSRLIMPQRLNWSAAVDLQKQLFNMVQRGRETRVVLDLRSVDKVYPNGIIPVITEIQHYVGSGLRVKVLPPEDKHTFAFFEKSGWLHYLDPIEWADTGFLIENPYALQRFSTYEELNNIINKVAKTCLKDLHFADGAHDAFIWSVNEIADNVLNHSTSKYGWVQVITYRDHESLALFVCDTGVGIFRTISQAFSVRDDEGALELAIRKGVTRDPSIGQGNGLAGTYAIAQHSQGSLAITSGMGRLTMFDGKLKISAHTPHLRGTYVDMTLRTNVEVDLPKAIGGKPMPFAEMQYFDEGGEIKIALREHASNFGNRATGRSMRSIIANFMTQYPGQPIKVDLTDVGIISSSFADELFGKLFTELGPLSFGQTIRPINVNPVCKELIDIAINQRVGQLSAMPAVAPIVRRARVGRQNRR